MYNTEATSYKNEHNKNQTKWCRTENIIMDHNHGYTSPLQTVQLLYK